MRKDSGVSPTPRPRTAARVLGAWVDAWLPAACIVCAVDERDGICEVCERSLPGYRLSRCPRCGLAAVADDAPCSHCSAAPGAFDRTIVLADYAAPLDRIVHALKFGRDVSLAAPLGRALARAVRAHPETLACARAHGETLTCARAHGETDTQPRSVLHAADGPIVTAIPLSTTRLAERGFNQSLEIARALAKALSAPLDRRLLLRVREGAPASTLHAADRRRALSGAFEAARRVDRRAVLVVDDVMTTGATLDAAAGALRSAGASVVINCVVARTRAADDPRRSRPP